MAIENLNDVKYSSKNKHIDIKLKMFQANNNEKIKVKYMPTEEMTADTLSKPLNEVKFTKFRNKMNLISKTMIQLFDMMMLMNIVFSSEKGKKYLEEN